MTASTADHFRIRRAGCGVEFAYRARNGVCRPPKTSTPLQSNKRSGWAVATVSTTVKGRAKQRAGQGGRTAR